MTPTAPGVYRLRLPTGQVVRRRVREINDGELYAVMPGGLLGLFSTLVPVEQLEWV
jgi:hypothetical protein